MGGAVSSGRDNTELIDNLMGGNYIRTRDVERVFRALDRGDYMTPEARDQAYKDLAWRNGPLHMSAPCIYSEVMEGLELKSGLSFLNVGSGTGYLSTLVGLILGSSGINHGVDVHPIVVEYATKKLSQFLERSPTLDEFDFCEPKFLCGNGLCLAPLQTPYDRVYCGAGCPDEYQNYFRQLIKVGGILVMPLNDNLLQVKRTGPDEWVTRSLLNVTFASLRVPSKDESTELLRLEEQTPARLQQLARSVIRQCMRGATRRRHPQVREPPPRAPPAKRACPRRICIPVDNDSDTEGLNGLHDLDRAGGANEMNALLSLVLSMGHNRVAGALRVDPLDSDSMSSYDTHDDRASPDRRILDDEPASDAEPLELNEHPDHNVLMFEFRDRNGAARHGSPPLPPLRRARRRRRRYSAAADDRDHDSGDRDVIYDYRDITLADMMTVAIERRQDVLQVREHELEDRQEDLEDREDDLEDWEDDLEDRENDLKVRDDDLEDKEDALKDGKDTMGDKKTFEDKEASEENTNVSEAKEVTPIDEGTSKDREVKFEKKVIKSILKNKESSSTSHEKDSSNSDFAPPQEESTSTWANLNHKEFKSKNKSTKCKKAPRRRSHRSSRATADEEHTKKKEDKQNPEVPAELEICLGKTQVAGPSTMEWENTEPIETETKAASSEDETTETSEVSKLKEEKRQKLDSGIGEENSPSAGSASHRSGASGEDSQSDTESDDEGCDEDVKGRRRSQKRGHLSTRSSSSTDEAGGGGRRAGRRSRLRTGHDWARRAQLSLFMKRAVKELPLPQALQKYVNLGRCFEF